MIGILLILCGLLWLGIETKWLTIRLPTGASQSAINTPDTDSGDDNSWVKALNEQKINEVTTHDLPTEFVSMNMPATSGELNIVCRMEN